MFTVQTALFNYSVAQNAGIRKDTRTKIAEEKRERSALSRSRYTKRKRQTITEIEKKKHVFFSWKCKKCYQLDVYFEYFSVLSIKTLFPVGTRRKNPEAINSQLCKYSPIGVSAKRRWCFKVSHFCIKLFSFAMLKVSSE